MKSHIHYDVKEPPRWLYSLLRFLISIYVKVFFGLRIQTKTPIPKSGPLIFICSHPGMMDFLFSAATVKERRLHYLSADYYFQHPLMGWLLRSLGAIPKMQFYPDMRSIAAVMQLLENGAAVAIFPAGQTSVDGTPTPISRSILRLVRRAGAPVAALRIHGSYFSYNRFCEGKPNHGRVEVEKTFLLTPEEIKSLDDEALFKTICDAIHFDDFAWQRQTGARFKGEHRAQGYENLLVRCPKCDARYSYHSEGNRVRCGDCGNSGEVGEDMRFIPDEGALMPADLQQWLAWQNENLLKAVEQKDFSITTAVKISRYGHFKDGFIGEGTARMDQKAIWFEGQLEGKATAFSVGHQVLPGLTGEFGDYFYVPHSDYGALCFHPEEGKSVIEWKVAQETLHGRLTG